MSGHNFKAYDKIPLDSNSWNRDYKKVKAWAATEKVHGANFSFVYSAKYDSFSYAKRGGILDEGDYFFGYRNILEETLPKVRFVINKVRMGYSEARTITIFGELFGGSYPGCESCGSPIQEGVYYSPQIHFYAFDIMISLPSQDPTYLDFEFSLDVFKEANLMYSEPLAICSSYEKASEYKVGFVTKIPSKLGLPEIPGNKAEGIVIRSLKRHYIVKIKIPEFSESKYSENDYNPSKPIDSLQSWINHCIPHITRNRFNNAISKVGELNEGNCDEIYENFVDDVLFEVNGFHVFSLREKLLDIIHEKFKISR